MKIVVHDASILIDLAICDAVEAWFPTEVETWTSELIFPREIEDPAQRRRLEAYAGSGKLRVHQTTEPAESLVEERDRLHRGLSLADPSVLLRTRKLGHDAVLATGNALLRRMTKCIWEYTTPACAGGRLGASPSGCARKHRRTHSASRTRWRRQCPLPCHRSSKGAAVRSSAGAAGGNREL